METSFFYRPFRVCFPITSAVSNFAFSYVLILAIKPITLLILYDLIALETKVSINSVSIFQFPKFLGEFEWLCLSHLPTLGLITKGTSHMPLGLLSKNVLHKGGKGGKGGQVEVVDISRI